MRLIMKTQFGSHVYGTNLPTSDTDIKGVFIPEFEDVVLQRAPKTVNLKTKLDASARNTAEDVDQEYFSVQQYLKLLAEGQTVALDMFFTPNSMHQIDPWSYWVQLKRHKDKFLHKGTASFVGYTKQQAAKYGVKGFRVSALKETLDMLKGIPTPWVKLHETRIEGFVEAAGNEHISIVECKGPNGTQAPHLQVCNRKVPFHATVKYATELFQKLYDEYGARALQAQSNQGIDWKALMHAVRVAREAEELLLTGNITFPRPEKDLLLQIRKGELDYENKVAPLIEEGLIRIDEAKAKSTLPESPDLDFIDHLVLDIYEDYWDLHGQY